MNTKTCNKCKIEKLFDEFYLRRDRNSLMSNCIQCTKLLAKSKTHEQREKYLQYNKRYNSIRTITRDLEKERLSSKKYREKNRELINEKEREKLKTNHQFYLTKKLRSRLSKFIRGKNKKIKPLLNCDLIQLINWIEYQFDENMSWENKSVYWEIDHVIPIAFFNLHDDDELLICANWCNIRPLKKLDNRQKSNKILLDEIENHQNICKKFTTDNKYTNILLIHDLIINMLKDRV